jgi:putative tricarboxylic transport membrane protein
MNKINRVFSIICLGVSLWLVIESTRYDYIVKYTPGPGFFPFWLGVVLAFFSFALLIETLRKKDRKDLNMPRHLPERQALYRVGAIILLTAALSLLMKYLGFVVSTALFVSGLLFFMERVPAIRSVITGVIMSVCVYLVFEYWMEIGLPAGILGF